MRDINIESDSVNFDLLIETMKSLLSEPLEKRDLLWATNTEVLSRDIHFDIWRAYLSQKKTEDIVIPLLKDATKKIREAMDGAELPKNDRQSIQFLRENIEKRIYNLQNNYLGGTISAFDPRDQLYKPAPRKEVADTQSKMNRKGVAMTVKFNVEFYDDKHRELLKDNCSLYERIEKLISSGFAIDKEELFSYAIFIEQKYGKSCWESFQELQERLPHFRRSWEEIFNFSGGTVHANFDTSLIHTYHKEALGVGGALSIVSKIYGLTEADWQKIPITQIRHLDFEIASTGKEFVQVEAKGSVVPDYHKSRISNHKRSIEDKKKVQREKQANSNTMLGVITVISNDSGLIAKCLILDPPAEDIIQDPYKYKLLARLFFYWREMQMISKSHFLEVLINRIKSIQLSEDYKSLNELPLLNRRGEPHQIPDSLFQTHSCVLDESAFGEAFPFDADKARFFFYGFNSQVVKSILKQNFEEINAMDFYPFVQKDAEVSAKIPKRFFEGTQRDIEDYDEKAGQTRLEIHMKGDLTHTPSGRVFGFLKPIGQNI